MCAPNAAVVFDAATVLDEIGDGFLALNREWEIVFMNKAAERMLGRSRADLVGLSLWDVYPDAVGSAFWHHYHRALETGQVVEFESSYAPLDLWLRVRAHPARDILSVYFADITAQRRAEEQSREADERLRLTVEAARAITWNWDFRSDQVVWTGDVPRLFGVGADEVRTAAAVMARLHPDDRPRIEQALAEAAAAGTDYASEFRVIRPDGSLRWVLAHGRVYKDAGGKVTRMAGIDLDVTDRKLAEEAVREALAHADQDRQLLEAVFEALTEGVFVSDTRGVAVRTNPAANAYFGFDPTGMSVAAIVAGLGIEGGIDASVTSAALRGVTIIGAEQIAGDRVIETSSAPLRDASGRVTGAVTISRDITRSKRAEEALRESEARFRAMADSIPQLAWMAKANGDLFWYNQRWYDYTGTTFEEMQGWGWQSVHHADHLDRVIARFRRSLETGEFWEDTFPLRGKTGEWRWFLSRALPIRNDDGEIVTWFGTNTDITEQLETQTALRDSEERFRQLAETVPGMVWTARTDGSVDYMNSQWSACTGQPQEEAFGAGWQAMLHPDDLKRSVSRWAESVSSGAAYEIEYRLKRRDGGYGWFLGRGRPLRSPAGEIVKWVGSCTDIHDQKATEEALRRSNEDLQQFAYVASHDLQEPLRIVVSFSQLLMQRHGELLDGDAKQYLSYVADAGTRMSALISDLLAYSRATTDTQRPRAAVRLEEVLESAVSAMRISIEETHAAITHDPLPVVFGDAAQLRHVLQNLISNALKYRKSGETPRLHVGVSRQPTEWVLSVSDNGQGFAPEYAARIFGIFKRLHGKEVPGTGIGLAICKTVVNRHGGRIWAESARGAGATFYFTLPVLDGLRT